MVSFKSEPKFRLLQNTVVKWVLPETFIILSYAELYGRTTLSHPTLKVFRRFLLRIPSGTPSIHTLVFLWCLFCSKESSGLSQFSHIHFLPNSIQPQLLPSKFNSATAASIQTRFNHMLFLPNSVQLQPFPSRLYSTTYSSFQIQFKHMLFLPHSIQSHPLASKFL
jgi:hypothetical protein